MNRTVRDLVKDPSKLARLDKPRRTACRGNCGRYVWDDYCRKRRRAMLREWRKRDGC